MEYFKQLKAFYGRLLINSLTSPEISLWHALMWQSNVLGWPAEFNVPLSTLEIYSGLSTAGVKRARNTLAAKGLIEWHSKKGRQSAVYKLVALYEPQNVPQSVPQSVPQNVPQSVPQSVPIHRLETIDKDNIAATAAAARERCGLDAAPSQSPPEDPGLAQAAQCYEANIGPLPRFVGERLQFWLAALGPDLVCEAIHRAAAANARSWNYAEKILRDWQNTGVRTVDAARMERAARQRTSAPRSQGAPGNRRETADEVWSKIAEGGDDNDQAGGGGFAAIDGEILAELPPGR